MGPYFNTAAERRAYHAELRQREAEMDHPNFAIEERGPSKPAYKKRRSPYVRPINYTQAELRKIKRSAGSINPYGA